MAPLTLVKLGAGAGVLLSLYALYVEMEINAAKAMGTDYKAACDMGTFASCSKVLASSCEFEVRTQRIVSVELEFLDEHVTPAATIQLLCPCRCSHFKPLGACAEGFVPRHLKCSHGACILHVCPCV